MKRSIFVILAAIFSISFAANAATQNVLKCGDDWLKFSVVKEVQNDLTVYNLYVSGDSVGSDSEFASGVKVDQFTYDREVGFNWTTSSNLPTSWVNFEPLENGQCARYFLRASSFGSSDKNLVLSGRACSCTSNL